MRDEEEAVMRDAIELFAGSGILGKAARDSGLVDSIRVQVEIDEYARAVLTRHEPEAARLVDVRELAAAATPGPWERVDSRPKMDLVAVFDGGGDLRAYVAGRADAAFIAAARTALPALLDALADARAAHMLFQRIVPPAWLEMSLVQVLRRQRDMRAAQEADFKAWQERQQQKGRAA